MTAAVAIGTLSAPQSVQEGPEPLGTRATPGARLHGAHRGLPRPCLAPVFSAATGAPP